MKEETPTDAAAIADAGSTPIDAALTPPEVAATSTTEPNDRIHPITSLIQIHNHSRLPNKPTRAFKDEFRTIPRRSNGDPHWIAAH